MKKKSFSKFYQLKNVKERSIIKNYSLKKYIKKLVYNKSSIISLEIPNKFTNIFH